MRTNVKIRFRCEASGRRTANRFGIRRRMAESMSFGLFVAPSTIIRSLLESSPSHSLQNRVSRFNGKKGAIESRVRHEFGFHHRRRFMVSLRTFPQKRVNLVDKDDARLGLPRKTEQTCHEFI